MTDLSIAPCYWTPPREGSGWRCVRCKGVVPQIRAYITLDVNGSYRTYCLACIEATWVNNAKYMGVMAPNQPL